jgi:6-pyruvoyltetrahydropterin/6-carboxytetrahydropterin synthase
VSYTICKTFRFEAAHQLHGLPEGHQCARMHGHSYRVDLELTELGAELDYPGFVVDFGRLKPFKEWIDKTLDHRVLNEILPVEPTAENLAAWIFSVVEIALPEWISGKVAAVRVHETETSWAEYRP